MSTYAEKMNEMRHIRAEMDKNLETYVSRMNELKKVEEALKAQRKSFREEYKKRDAELNALFLDMKRTTDSKTMDDIIKDLNREEDIERDILRELEEQGDFITPNQTAFDKYSPAELFQAIYNLVDKGVLRKRDCDGTAYEYNK